MYALKRDVLLLDFLLNVQTYQTVARTLLCIP